MRIYFILLDSKNERKEKGIMKVLVVFSEQKRWMEAVELRYELARETNLVKEGFHFIALDTSQIQVIDLMISPHHPVYQYFTKREIINFLKAQAEKEEKEMTYKMGQKVLIKKMRTNPNDPRQAKVAEMSNQIGTIMNKVNGFYHTVEWLASLRHEEIVRKATSEDYIGHYVMVPEIEQIMKIVAVDMSVRQGKRKFIFQIQSMTSQLRCSVDESQVHLINPECITDSITGKRFYKYTYWLYHENGEPKFYTLADLVEYWETDEMTPDMIAEVTTFDSGLAGMEKMQIYNKRTRA